MFNNLFQLRGDLSKTQQGILIIVGLFLFLLLWWGVAEMNSIKRPIVEDYTTHLPSSINKDSAAAVINIDSLLRADSIKIANATEFEKVYPLLPTPGATIASFPTLVNKENVIGNTLKSIWLNLQGYYWAVLFSIPLGFVIGLFPVFRGLFSKQVDALRYLPLTAITGLFILWFGLDDGMKIAFLAFGIIVYLLPVVVQRIDEVQDVYLKTVFTLGATDWQTIKTVYIPSVMSKVIDDIRVLTAISWTYIIIAELLNRQGGGIGSMLYIKGKQGQTEQVFALLMIIILVGFIQDRLFVYLDKRLFPHKYHKTVLTGISEVKYGIITLFGLMTLAIIQSIWLPSMSEIMMNIIIITAIASLLMMAYGEYKLRMSVKEN